MKRTLSLLLPLAVLTLAAPALAQTAPATAPASTSASDDITRELNGGPPTSTLPARPPVAAPVTPPVTRQPVAAPAQAAPSVSQPTAAPAQPTTRPTTNPPAAAGTTPAAGATPATTTPAATAEEPAAPPPPPPPTVLDAAAIAALPFTVDLPTGFEITTGRPGPDFKVYTVRRNGTPFVMIYAGPSALFPIYEGDAVEAAGRASILVTEGNRRRALEHLFNRDGAPRQVHVWVASVEDGDRDLAESIAQSVDVP